MPLRVFECRMEFDEDSRAYTCDIPRGVGNPVVLDFSEPAPGKVGMVWVAAFSDNDDAEGDGSESDASG